MASQTEAEMSHLQRSLVDVCFEEGQYDSGIAVLDQLRSPSHKPSASHIRQLLYIALYPPTSGKDKPFFDPTASPSKANKQQKYSLSLSPETTAAAQRLLLSFAHTNTPEAVARTLPRYSASIDENLASGNDDLDSVIALESLCIVQCKSCWNILTNGFIQRPTHTTKPKGKKRRSTMEDDSIGSIESLPSEERVTIGQHAWPILDWLLVLFERDELLTRSPDTPVYSPLLLSQLPTPRGGKEARWELDAPIDVIFYCLRQNEERRQLMASRLMTLLINLSSTIYLDFPMFITSVYSRISALSAPDFSLFLSSLTNTPSVLKFKIALCQKFLVTSDVAQTTTRPKAQARAQPKAVRATRTVDDIKEEPAVIAPVQPTPSIAVNRPTPSSAEILRLMEIRTKLTSSWANDHDLKFELVVSYAILQTQILAEDRDPDWPVLLRGGLSKTFDAAFGPKGGADRQHRELVDSMARMW